MRLKAPTRRTPVVIRHRGKKDIHADDVSHRAASRFSKKAFFMFLLTGIIGFPMVLVQFSRAANSTPTTTVGVVAIASSENMFLSPTPARMQVTPQDEPSDSHTSVSTIPILRNDFEEPIGRAGSSGFGLYGVTPIKPLFPMRVPVISPVALEKQLLAGSSTLLSEGWAADLVRNEKNQNPALLHNCKWRQHPGQYLGEFASPGTTEKEEAQAKEDCITQGTHRCGGVTCSFSRTRCSARRGTPYLATSLENEISFTWECEGSLNSRALIEPDLPTVSPDFAIQEVDTSVFRRRQDGLREPLRVGRAALVIIAHDRPDCLSACLRTIVSQDGVDVFKLVVSLDDQASFLKMEKALKEFQANQPITVWKKPSEFLKKAEQKIAAHFRFALSQSFDQNKFEFAVFIENDLTLAPDALWYFRSAAWLLEEDPSLFCVSAWNDNGIQGLVSNETKLFRTDYFPGLGWMIRNTTWLEIKHIWPKNPTTGWDHWLRHGANLRPRECVVPEISRTHHFDTKGTNVKAGGSIAKRLEKMVTSKLPPGELQVTSALLLDEYEEHLKRLLLSAETISQSRLEAMTSEKTYMLPYVREEYQSIAKQLDIYEAQPRAAHRGAIVTRHPRNHAIVVLVDRRQNSGFLSEVDALRPNPTRRIGGAQRGQSCDQFCQSHYMRCDPRELEFINYCSVLKKYFPCEGGCGHQVGAEIPCYVHDPALDTALQCLVVDGVIPTCQASHRSTTRLCACVL